MPMMSIFIGVLRYSDTKWSFRLQRHVGIEHIDLRNVGIVHIFQMLIDRLGGAFTRDADPNVVVQRQNESRMNDVNSAPVLGGHTKWQERFSVSKAVEFCRVHSRFP